MVMDATPKEVSAKEIDPTGRYRCPLCMAQTTRSVPDIGWVLCPMIDNRPICSGCCLDYQSVAVSYDFDGHPSREDFDALAGKTGKGVPTLRLTCLQHQESVLIARLKEDKYPHFVPTMHELLATIRIRMKSLDEW